VTHFTHVADGPHRTARAAAAAIPSNVAAVVLDVCEVGYFDWADFAYQFFEEVTAMHEGWDPLLILETRGEREWQMTEVETYLHLTPGYTLPCMHVMCDQVKLLIQNYTEVRAAIKQLSPFAERGIPAFVLPRVGNHVEAYNQCHRSFMACNPENVRLMPILHELLGYD
jgi:hypothetical protein